MSDFDNIFKHKIGSTVKSVVSMGKAPTCMQVVSRVLEECPGGAQYHYHCRQYTTDGYSTQLLKFNDVEIEACDILKDVKEFRDEDHSREMTNMRELETMRYKVRKELRDRDKKEGDDEPT